MKKIDWKLIIIAILALLVIIEGIFLLKKDSKGEPLEVENKSSMYTNDNVISKVSNDIDVDYSIYRDGKSMLLKITSLDKDILTSTVNVVFKNDNNVVIDNITTYTGALVKDNVYAINLNVPNVTDGYAGDIEITINPTYVQNKTTFLDKNQLNLNHSEIINDDKSITMTVSGVNPFEQTISMLSGLAIFYNNSEVVYVTRFSQSDITSGNEINIDVDISPDENGNLLTYDNVEIIINELYYKLQKIYCNFFAFLVALNEILLYTKYMSEKRGPFIGTLFYK